MRGMYGRALVGDDNPAIASNPAVLAQRFDAMARAVRIYLAADPVSQGPLAGILIDLGISVDDATAHNATEWEATAAKLRAQAEFWKDPHRPPPLPRAPGPMPSGPSPSFPGPPPLPGQGPMMPGPPPLPGQAGPAPAKPGPIDRVKQTWNRIPQGDRTALKVGALATGAVAITAVVIAVASKKQKR